AAVMCLPPAVRLATVQAVYLATEATMRQVTEAAIHMVMEAARHPAVGAATCAVMKAVTTRRVREAVMAPRVMEAVALAPRRLAGWWGRRWHAGCWRRWRSYVGKSRRNRVSMGAFGGDGPYCGGAG